MAKRIFFILISLALGFGLGAGAVFYLKSNKLEQRGIPVVSHQVEDGAKAFSEVVSAVSPSVVNISTVKFVSSSDFSEDPFFEFFNDFFGQLYDTPKRWKEQSMGSGVIASEDGYIITNNHVVSDAEEINVTLYDKRTLKGRVVGSDPKTDIAVVKIDADGLPVVPWGDSDQLKVGEFVLAIGNPFGLSHTVTMGIISAIGRADVGIAEYEDFIQTDAAINPGNSGGPLVDIKGRLIGINTAIFSKNGGFQGIGFAVPSNMARLLMEELIKQGKIIRGWLGVTIQELTPSLSKEFGYNKLGGALVDEVIDGSPAQKAGIRRGDIIIEYGEKAVDGPSSLKNLVARSKPGSQVSIKYFRLGRYLTTNALVTEAPREPGVIRQSRREEAKPSGFTGLSVIDITDDISKQLGLRADEKGVVVIKVRSGTPAEDSGLRRGDVILEIDRRPVRNVAEYNRIISTLSKDTVLLYISRGTRKFFLTLQTS